MFLVIILVCAQLHVAALMYSKDDSSPPQPRAETSDDPSLMPSSGSRKRRLPSSSSSEASAAESTHPQSDKLQSTLIAASSQLPVRLQQLTDSIGRAGSTTSSGPPHGRRTIADQRNCDNTFLRFIVRQSKLEPQLNAPVVLTDDRRGFRVVDGQRLIQAWNANSVADHIEGAQELDTRLRRLQSGGLLMTGECMTNIYVFNTENVNLETLLAEPTTFASESYASSTTRASASHASSTTPRLTSYASSHRLLTSSSSEASASTSANPQSDQLQSSSHTGQTGIVASSPSLLLQQEITDAVSRSVSATSSKRPQKRRTIADAVSRSVSTTSSKRTQERRTIATASAPMSQNYSPTVPVPASQSTSSIPASSTNQEGSITSESTSHVSSTTPVLTSQASSTTHASLSAPESTSYARLTAAGRACVRRERRCNTDDDTLLFNFIVTLLKHGNRFDKMAVSIARGRGFQINNCQLLIRAWNWFSGGRADTAEEFTDRLDRLQGVDTRLLMPGVLPGITYLFNTDNPIVSFMLKGSDGFDKIAIACLDELLVAHRPPLSRASVAHRPLVAHGPPVSSSTLEALKKKLRGREKYNP